MIIEELEFDPLDDGKSQPHHRHAYHRVAQESTGGHRGSQVPTVLTKKRIIADDAILYIVQSNWRSKGLFRMMKRIEAQMILGSSGQGTSITSTAMTYNTTTAPTGQSSINTGAAAAVASSSSSSCVKKSSTSNLLPFDFASSSTSYEYDSSTNQKSDQKLTTPSNVHASSCPSSSSYSSTTNVGSPQRMRPSTRSLLKWAASAKGSFRRLSRMSSFTSRTKERSASTDRDSSTGKSDSFDSPNDNNVTY